MSRRRTLAVAGVALFVAAGVWALSGRGNAGRIDRARDLLADADRFDTPIEAAETLARAGQLLLDDAAACREDHGDVPRCHARSSASATAQVFAVEVLACTAPGRFEARTRMLAYVQAVAVAVRAVPPPPSPPDC